MRLPSSIMVMCLLVCLCVLSELSGSSKNAKYGFEWGKETLFIAVGDFITLPTYPLSSPYFHPHPYSLYSLGVLSNSFFI